MSQKGLILPFILLSVTALTVIGFLSYQKQHKSSPPPTPKPSPSQTSLENLSWETFTSKNGFSFKYPAWWSVKTTAWTEGKLRYDLDYDAEEAKIRFVETDQPPHRDFPYGATITVMLPQNNPRKLPINEWVKSEIITGRQNAVSESTILVAGNSAVQVKEKSSGQIIHTFIPHQDKIYQVILHYIPNLTTDADYNGILDYMLSTFKFTTSQYTCPDSEWINCMPVVDKKRAWECESGYLQWAKANCPNFKGPAY